MLNKVLNKIRMFFSRGPNKIQNPYTFKEMYDHYYNGLVDGKNSPLYVEYDMYVKICSDYYKAIMEMILDDGLTYRMPHGLGLLKVAKRKVKLSTAKRIPIDWVETFKHNKKIYCLNEHTDGFRYFFFWSKPNTYKNKFLYRLVLTRQNKRKLARLIKSSNKDYFEV